MKNLVRTTIVCLSAAATALAADRNVDKSSPWPAWRGPLASGVAPNADPPVEWAEDKNIRWKVKIPGSGNASPIIWGDLVFIQTAVKTDTVVESDDDKSTDVESNDPPAGRSPHGDRDGRAGRAGRRGRGMWRRETPTHLHKFIVMALDRKTGKTVWQRTVREELPHESGHGDTTHAACSPVVDGQHIYAYFGSRGLYCLDMQGEVIWEKDFGDTRTRNQFGDGASPVLYMDTIVVNWDHEDQSFIVALDKNTGDERWRVDRDEVTSWATPLIVEHQGRAQVITSGTKRVRSYDLATGKVVWECGGLGKNCIPSPVANSGTVYMMSGYRDPQLLAIRYEGASGDITDSGAVTWRTSVDTSYVPSPLLYNDKLYFLKKNSAILSCYDAKTGKPHYTKQRLAGVEGVYASPVAANDHIYIAGRNGTTVVIKNASKYEALATNTLDDGFDASPAIVGSELYLRGRKYLYCIARD